METKDVSAGTSSRRVDALRTVAESFLASGPQELTGGDRQQIVLHVDAETLKHDCAGRCEFEHGPAIAAETARRPACDASLVAIVENGRGEPLDVGYASAWFMPRAETARNVPAGMR